MSGQPKSLLLVDLSGIWWANWHATADQEIGEAFKKTVDKVRKLASGHDYTAVCCDHPPYFRLELLPSYKGHREKPTEVSLEQFRRVRTRLVADGMLLWDIKGFESDDLIASAVRLARRDGLAVTIASSDKDLLQLVDDEAWVTVYSPAKDKAFDEAAVFETWGVPPSLLLESLALQGDTSDNVPGIPGVAGKTAAALITEFKTLDGVFSNLDRITKPKLKASLVENEPAARLARKLIELRTDCPVDWGKVYEERKVMPIVEVLPKADELDVVLPAVADEKAAITKKSLDPPTTTALAVSAQPSEWIRELEPRTLGKALSLAEHLYETRMYPKLPSAAGILAVILRGREMGIGAATALDVFSYFEGKVNPGAYFIIARGKAHPDCEYLQFVSGDDTYAEWITKNRNNPTTTTMRYTMDQAIKAKLVKKDGNWETRPAEMLRKTCGVQLVRAEYPGSMHGATATEEVES